MEGFVTTELCFNAVAVRKAGLSVSNELCLENVVSRRGYARNVGRKCDSMCTLLRSCQTVTEGVHNIVGNSLYGRKLLGKQTSSEKKSSRSVL